jgi:dihydrofolate reductase
MTTFHAFLGCSLDGFIAGPHGELDWLTTFDDRLGDTGYDAFFAATDAMVMGRSTYDTMREIGPEFYGETPVYVLSTTLPAGRQPNLGRSAVTVYADLPALRAALKADGVGRAYVDGGRTVQTFLAAGLLGDLVITRVPVIIGEGIPLFGPVPAPVPAELVETRQLNAGAVQSTYRFATHD